MSKEILALPTKLDHLEIFEQTVTAGFSSVNIRLAFNTKFYCQVVYNLRLDGK